MRTRQLRVSAHKRGSILGPLLLGIMLHSHTPVALGQPTDTQTHRYPGVVLDKNAAQSKKPHRAQSPRRRRSVQVTWIGLQPQSASHPARLFVQSKAAMDAQLTGEGLSWRLTLPGARVRLRNTLRPLDLRHFDLALQYVRPAPGRRKLVLHLSLRRAATLTIERAQDARGMHYLIVDGGG
ncbi:MAG: hypothetical protein ACPGUV_12730 [Polyangiales bacterium]